jgi:hypothetical protein
MRQIGEKVLKTSLLSSNRISETLIAAILLREGLSKDLALNLTQWPVSGPNLNKPSSSTISCHSNLNHLL